MDLFYNNDHYDQVIVHTCYMCFTLDLFRYYIIYLYILYFNGIFSFCLFIHYHFFFSAETFLKPSYIYQNPIFNPASNKLGRCIKWK